MLSEAWMDQLMYQAEWVAADLFPGQAVGLEPQPASKSVLLTNAEGTRALADVMLGGVYFHKGATPTGLKNNSTWDEIVSYCNSLVNEG